MIHSVVSTTLFPPTSLLLEVLFMKSHPCVFLCTTLIHSIISFNTFCSIILLLVTGGYVKLQCQFGSGITITYKAEWYWCKADNQSHRLALRGSSGGQHLIHPTTSDLTFSIYIHSRYLMLDWKNRTQKFSEITRVSGTRLSKRSTASGISLQQEIKFISQCQKNSSCKTRFISLFSQLAQRKSIKFCTGRKSFPRSSYEKKLSRLCVASFSAVPLFIRCN